MSMNGLKKFRHPIADTGIIQRRRRDSNPRGPEAKRISSAPRYDRFDTSPKSTLLTISVSVKTVNTPEKIFSFSVVENRIEIDYTVFSSIKR